VAFVLSNAWAASRGRNLVLALALAAVVVLLGSTSILVQQEFDRSTRIRELVDQTFERRVELQRVLSLHQDLETGQRGYIITGDERFLQPFIDAKDRLDRELASLHSQLADEPEVVEVRRLSAAKLAFSEAAIQARREEGTASASRMVAEGDGKVVMDELRASIARLDRKQTDELAARTAEADSARRSSQRLAISLLVILLLLLLLAGSVTMRTISARRRAAERAEDAGARYLAILESAKDGIISLNPSGTIEGVNGAAGRMFGYSPKELRRRDVGILFEIAPDRGAVETFLKRLRMRSAEGRIDEFMARRSDGTLIPCEVAISPMELATGTFYVAVVRDVSERKQIEKMKSEFVSTVSHELRTPLTSIAGSLGLIAGGAAGALPDRAARLVDIALANSRRLVRLINDILDIEKIESGKMPFEPKELMLADFLEQALAANQGFADEHGVAIQLAPVPNDAAVFADPDRLMQVLNNLLSNAAKFSPAGENVLVSVKALDRRWRIDVADKGGGIPEAFRKRVFEKFAQADSSDTRAKGGTGLGLSIVREIMTRLGGDVSFDTDEGVGTVFHVDVPAARRDEAPANPVEDASLPAILHLDDDADVLQVVASAFRGKAVVQGVTNLAEARQLVAARRFDLIIIDIGLAEGSGLDLLPQEAKTIIFTAQDSDPTLIARADAVLVKSRANLDQLVATAEGLLSKVEAK
jgi:PAS domain S-box-containing protein